MTTKIIQIYKPLSKTIKDLFNRPKKVKKSPKHVFLEYVANIFVGPVYFGCKAVINTSRAAAYFSGSLFGGAIATLSLFFSKSAREFTRFSFQKAFECLSDVILDAVSIVLIESVSIAGFFAHLSRS